MNAKEKAEELVDRYFKKFYDDSGMGWSEFCAKQCALIAVDEIIKSLRKDLAIFELGKGYWQEVKKEIEKL